MHRSLGLISAAIVVAMTVAACGGGEETAAPTTPVEAASTVRAATTTTVGPCGEGVEERLAEVKTFLDTARTDKPNPDIDGAMEDMREKAVPECAGTADAAVFYESVLLAMEKFEPPTDATAAIIWTGYYNLLKSQACQSAAELMLVLSPAALFVCNTGK